LSGGELANCCIPQLLGEMQQYNIKYWIMMMMNDDDTSQKIIFVYYN